MSDVIYLAIGGFLLGSVLYSGWYTTLHEPEARIPYAFIGTGVGVAISVSSWVEFIIDRHFFWSRIFVLTGYLLIAIGLSLLIRERRRRFR